MILDWVSCYGKAPLVAILILFGPTVMASPLVSLVTEEGINGGYTREWAWALRGGGVDLARPRHLRAFFDAESERKGPSLLILDSLEVDASTVSDLTEWVRKGGLLLFLAGEKGLQVNTANPSLRKDIPLHDLLGVTPDYDDPGLKGSYPLITQSSPLLSPLIKGDGLRFGRQGMGSSMRFRAITPSEVIAKAVRLIQQPQVTGIPKETASLVVHRVGQGMVVFAGFSLGRIAACYPENPEGEATDCSGAGSAHALMRWLVANLFWEERKVQIPLLTEAPGTSPHAVVMTGDVHRIQGREEPSPRWMVERARKVGVPVSIYIEADYVPTSPETMQFISHQDDVELAPHSFDGTVAETRRYFWGRFSVFWDYWKTGEMLQLGRFGKDRLELLSERDHGWRSDQGAWWAMRKFGIGLVFDQVADTLFPETPWRMGSLWFSSEPAPRAFVPIFEHSISTATTNFRLDDQEFLDIANLASAQADPVDIVGYPEYDAYVRRWHRLFDRMSSMGGLTEVWLFHPSSFRNADWLNRFESLLIDFKANPHVRFYRGDVIANWRANRERFALKIQRTSNEEIQSLSLKGPSHPLYPLPQGSPVEANSVGYWVLGPMNLHGETVTTTQDAYRRTVSFFSLPIPTQARGAPQ